MAVANEHKIQTNEAPPREALNDLIGFLKDAQKPDEKNKTMKVLSQGNEYTRNNAEKNQVLDQRETQRKMLADLETNVLGEEKTSVTVISAMDKAYVDVEKTLEYTVDRLNKAARDRSIPFVFEVHNMGDDSGDFTNAARVIARYIHSESPFQTDFSEHSALNNDAARVKNAEQQNKTVRERFFAWANKIHTTDRK
ncbi:MAG TPA: hypothetical protein VLH19_01685 [Patescibacteria group bacterium]|nr:hypothetical protein [Patescibacteria group bacterium]